MLQKIEREKTRVQGLGGIASDRQRPRHRVVAYLGQLQESTRQGLKQVAEGKGKPKFIQAQLFDGDTIEERMG